MGTARNKRVTKAWLRGLPVPDAANVLHISQSRAVKEKVTASGREETRQDVGALRRESLAWWEERAIEGMRRGRGGDSEEDDEAKH